MLYLDYSPCLDIFRIDLFFYNAFWLQNPKYFRKNVQGGIKKFHKQTNMYGFCPINSSYFVRFHGFHEKKVAEFWQV